MTTDDHNDPMLRHLLEACPAGVLALHADGRVGWINSTLQQLLGVTAQELAEAEPGSSVATRLAGLLADDDTICVRDHTGTERQLQHTRVCTRADESDAGEVHYYLDQTAAAVLQSEKIALQQQVSSLSLADPVTGLMSQRALMMVLEPQVSRSRRYNNPLSIVVLEVDVTAARSNAQARSVQLRMVSALLKDQLRWADLIGLDDHGNFVLLLPETGKSAAAALATKVARSLESEAVVRSFHFGVTEWNKIDNAASLLSRAESALAQARDATDAAVVTL